MSRPRIAVTGLGAVSGFGAGVSALWHGLCEGRRALRAYPDLAALTASPLGLCPQIPFDAPGRATQLATLAAREALEDAGDPPRGPRLGICVGTTLGSIGGWLPLVRRDAAGEAVGAPPRHFTYAGPAQALAEDVRARGPVRTASVACASGNAALGLALDALRTRACDVVLAGGVDALCDFVITGFGTLKALDAEPCRPFDVSRRGLNLGEGAAFLVLEREDDARARGARVRAFFDGYGSAADAVHMTGPDCQGRGAARAMSAALADATAAPADVGHLSAHGTATVFNDLMEGKAARLVFGDAGAARVVVNSLKGALGHTLGAAGALEAVAVVRSLESGQVPPTTGLTNIDPEIALDVVHAQPRALDFTTALSTSSGFGGTNAAIVLRRA